MPEPRPRRGGGQRRETCHLGHPIETRVYAGKPKRRCWTCNRENQRQHARSTPYRKKARRRSRLKVYGLSEDDFDAMLERQQGRCAICRQPLDTDYRRCVDHDHATGRVRGLLCRTCNLGIGHLNDDPALLRAALEYLL